MTVKRRRQLTPYTIHGRCSAGQTDSTPDGRRDIYRPTGLPAWTLNYTAAGTGRFTVGEHTRLTQVGDLVLIKPNIENDYGIDDHQQHWVHLWAVFHPEEDWYPLLQWPPLLDGHLHVHIDDEAMRQRIVDLFAALIEAAHCPYSQRDQICLSLLKTILLWARTSLPDQSGPGLDPRIRRSMALICDRVPNPPGMAELAAAAGLSVSRYAHLFRDEVGMTPMAYLEQQRMTRACDLLVMTGRPIADLAHEVGYEDPAYFARLFKRHLGETPSSFRRSSRQALSSQDL